MAYRRRKMKIMKAGEEDEEKSKYEMSVKAGRMKNEEKKNR